MNAYYNEHDPFAAAWLRGLIGEGLIAPGFVDERDIRDVQPADLAGYDRHHFFAGIGGWDYALQLAGWDGPVWTGSCPCQPFSSAGKGQGFDDPRHLWPAWFRLIRECRPSVVFGEQVASKDGVAWLDHVATDLETVPYAFGAADLPAAGVGAFHIRQRLWFVADTECARVRDRGRGSDAGASCGSEGEGDQRQRLRDDARADGGRALADSAVPRRNRSENGRAATWPCCESERARDQSTGRGEPQREGSPRRLADAEGAGLPERERVRWRSAGLTRPERDGGLADPDGGLSGNGNLQRSGEHGQQPQDGRAPWSDVVWLPCRDGKARPTKPGLFPLAHGVPNRVGTLRGAGNAICPQAAAEFIGAYLEAREAR
jgi:DNA (cytosine-5)-methyltransferase 1